MSYTLNWTPSNWKERLAKAMSAECLTVESLIQRQLEINSLWYELDKLIKADWNDGFTLACHQKSFYDLLKHLVERETIPVSEWIKKTSLSVLNMDPFYRITEISGDEIIVNKEKLLLLKPEDLYSWHYEIARSVIEELKLV